MSVNRELYDYVLSVIADKSEKKHDQIRDKIAKYIKDGAYVEYLIEEGNCLTKSIEANDFELFSTLCNESKISERSLDAPIGHEEGRLIIQVMDEDVDDSFLEFLLKQNANPNVQNSSGETALIIGASLGANVKVELLLSNEKIKLEIKDHEGDSAFTVAVKEKQAEIICLLLDHGHSYENVELDSNFIKENTYLFQAHEIAAKPYLGPKDIHKLKILKDRHGVDIEFSIKKIEQFIKNVSFDDMMKNRDKIFPDFPAHIKTEEDVIKNVIAHLTNGDSKSSPFISIYAALLEIRRAELIEIKKDDKYYNDNINIIESVIKEIYDVDLQKDVAKYRKMARTDMKDAPYAIQTLISLIKLEDLQKYIEKENSIEKLNDLSNKLHSLEEVVLFSINDFKSKLSYMDKYVSRRRNALETEKDTAGQEVDEKEKIDDEQVIEPKKAVIEIIHGSDEGKSELQTDEETTNQQGHNDVSSSSSTSVSSQILITNDDGKIGEVKEKEEPKETKQEKPNEINRQMLSKTELQKRGKKSKRGGRGNRGRR